MTRLPDESGWSSVSSSTQMSSRGCGRRTLVEEFFGDLRSVKRCKQSTVRRYQNALRLFCSYVSDPDYGWDRVCEQRFGTHPAQVFFEWNTAIRVQDNEQSPAKRAFTKRELQDFFDHADDQVALIAASARKGWLPAYRDATMFKVAYSYGLRFNELRHLQTVDFSRNAHARDLTSADSGHTHRRISGLSSVNAG
jgi:integrase/recombinase XerD